MDPITIAMVAAQLMGGIAGSRANKRQTETSLLSADIEKAFTQSNILKSATEGFGNALVASARAGGYAPNAFSGSWSNVAADWSAAQSRYDSTANQSLAGSSANRANQIFSAVNSLLSLWNSKRTAKANRSLIQNSPSTYSLLDLSSLE